MPPYIIVAVAFNGKRPTHQELAEAVNFQVSEGYVPLGAPFEGEDAMYQAMVLKSRQMS